MLRLTGLLLFGGLVGKVLGVLRELLSASLFGTGFVASAYKLSQSAFLIPVHGIVSETVSVLFTPQFSREKEASPERAQLLFASLHSILACASLLMASGMFFAAARWVNLLAPGFDVHTAQTAKVMVMILSCAVPAYVLFNLYAAVEMVSGSGRLAASRASIQSVGLICGSVGAYLFATPWMIAVGFVVAYWILAYQGWRFASAQGLYFIPKGKRKAVWHVLSDLGRGFRILIWVPLAMQVNLVVERQVASMIDPGAVAALDYARFISETAIALVAMPFASAGLAIMATLSKNAFEASVLNSIRALMFIGIPISSLCWTHAELIVRVLFMRGAFESESLQLTSAILRFSSIALFATLIGYTGSKFLTARGRTSVVLLAVVCACVVNAAVNGWMYKHLGASALGLGNSAYGLVLCSIVLWCLRLYRKLAREGGGLLLAGVLYGFVIGVTDMRSADWVLSMVGAIAYWGVFFVGIPHNRRVLRSVVSSMRSKELPAPYGEK